MIPSDWCYVNLAGAWCNTFYTHFANNLTSETEQISILYNRLSVQAANINVDNTYIIAYSVFRPGVDHGMILYRITEMADLV